MTNQENSKLWEEYLYPGTNVLKNNFDIHDKEELKKVEATYSLARILELQREPIDLHYGKEQLNFIHKYIFKDIYHFAGEYRKVNLIKERGTFLFINSSEDIDKELDILFLDTNNMLLNCKNKMDFCSVLANLYTKLIFIHPYREGNGRTIREFLREFSINKSIEIGLGAYELDFEKIDKNKLNEFVEVSHILPGSTLVLFMDALVSNNKKTK